MLVAVVGCVMAVTFYDPSSALYQKLDTIFSQRFSLGYQGLAQYGITAFGSFVEENRQRLDIISSWIIHLSELRLSTDGYFYP